MRDGKGFLLVYNITSRATFEEIVPLHDKILRTKDSESTPMSVDAVRERARGREEERRRERDGGRESKGRGGNGGAGRSREERVAIAKA